MSFVPGSGRREPDVTDLILSVGRHRIVGKLVNHRLVSRKRGIVDFFLLAGQTDIELGPRGVSPIGRGPDDRRENLYGSIERIGERDTEKLALFGVQKHLPDPELALDCGIEVGAGVIPFYHQPVGVGRDWCSCGAAPATRPDENRRLAQAHLSDICEG